MATTPKSIANNIAWITADRVFRIGLNLLVDLQVIRFLGPQDFGELIYAIGVVSIVASLASLGLREVAVKELVAGEYLARRVLINTFALQCASSAVAVIALSVFFLLSSEATAVGLLVTVSVAVKPFEVALYWFESRLEYRIAARAYVIAAVSTASLKIGMMILNAPVEAFAAAYTAELIVGGGVLFLSLQARARSMDAASADREAMISLLKQGAPLLIASLGVMLYMRSDVIMLRLIQGDEAAGVYGAAARISESMYFLPTAIASSFFPALIEARSRSLGDGLSRLRALLQILVLVTSVLVLTTVSVAEALVSIVLGAEFAESAEVLSVHVFGLFFVSFGSASGKWLVSEGLQRIALERALAGAVANISLNAVLIPHYGGVGAAWATVASFSVAALFYDIVHARTRAVFVEKIRSLNLLESLASTVTWWRARGQ